MDFALTAEQDELVKTLRAFARKELAPRSRDWDRTGEFPWSAWRQMGELGLLGLRIPAAYGGQESDYMTFGLAMEEVARGDFGCTYGIQLAGLAGEIVGATGTEEVKSRWLPPTARGEEIIALALTEPGAGSDAAHLACRAERDGDSYLITGEKSGISLAMAAQSAVLFARTGATAGARGVTAFLVPSICPACRGASSGTWARTASAAPCCPSTTCVSPARTGLGTKARASTRSCAGSTTTASASRWRPSGWPRSRWKRPWATSGAPGLRQAARDLRGHLVPDRRDGDAHRRLPRTLLSRDVARRPGPAPQQGVGDDQVVGPKLAVETIHQCLLFHGHYGYTDELPFEQRMRDVIGLEIGDGTAEVMKTIVARELMGRESRPY